MPNVAGSKSDDDDLHKESEVVSSTESVEASTSEVSRQKEVPVEEPWKKGLILSNKFYIYIWYVHTYNKLF